MRLRALADTPSAFLTTLAEAEVEPASYWDEYARDGASAEDEAVFLADGDLGMAGVFVRDAAPVLFGMWVAPEARGQGLGRALVAAVEDWARERGFVRITLCVAAGNDAAAALYRSCGYEETGERATGRFVEVGFAHGIGG